MLFGTTLRNMGPQSATEIVAACAAECDRAAAAGWLESLWITDHIAIPPDDAEGSGGRYLDTLTTLAWLAGTTQHIKLGSGVLILPYRTKLPTAKQVATVQELSEGRLLLGVGIGWMDAEFRALGVDRHQRGAMSDDILEFLNQCFAQDEVRLNDQAFLFKPRPPKPPIIVGGRPPHALERAARLADGWMPMTRSPDEVEGPIADYRRLTDRYHRPPGQVTAMTSLPLEDEAASLKTIERYRQVGVDRLVCALRYDTVNQYQQALERLRDCVEQTR